MKWGDLITLEYGKSLSDYKESNAEIPVYGTNGPIGFTDKPLCNFPSVIVGRKGAYRGVHYSHRPFFVIDTAFYVKPKSENLDLKYCYYYLKTLDINSMDSGSAIPSTSRDDFYDLPANIPDLPTQTAIAEILSSLDDKIELNNQINKNLEALAQAIFKRWFVDFEFPNENGQPYKSSGGEMVDSELGMIPKGWEVGSLADVGKNIRQSIDPKAINAQVPYLGLEHIGRKCLSVYSSAFASEATSQKARFRQWDILFGKLRPYFHKVAVAPYDGICSTDILVVRPITDSQFGYLLCHLFSESLVDYASQVADGTRMPRVSWHQIQSYKILLPDNALLESFNTTVSGMIESILINTSESKTLESLREMLLPKLISGELTIKDSQKILTEA